MKNPFQSNSIWFVLCKYLKEFTASALRIPIWFPSRNHFLNLQSQLENILIFQNSKATFLSMDWSGEKIATIRKAGKAAVTQVGIAPLLRNYGDSRFAKVSKALLINGVTISLPGHSQSQSIVNVSKLTLIQASSEPEFSQKDFILKCNHSALPPSPDSNRERGKRVPERAMREIGRVSILLFHSTSL